MKKFQMNGRKLGLLQFTKTKALNKTLTTQTFLHNVIEYVLDKVNENEINGICMFDLAKCFDTIDHKLLLKKLSKYGLNGTEI